MKRFYCTNGNEKLRVAWRTINNAYVPVITVCNERLYYQPTNSRVSPVLEPDVEIVTEVGDDTISVELSLTNNDTTADAIYIYRNTSDTFKTAEVVGSIFLDDGDTGLFEEELPLTDGGYYYFVRAVNTLDYVKSPYVMVQTEDNGQLGLVTFSPDGGSSSNNRSVTLSHTESGVAIYYTTDGSTPTTSSSLYSSAITVSTSGTVIKAIASKSGWTTSEVATSSTFTFVASDPQFSVSSGTYTDEQSVQITSATSGSSIYYTMDGSTPTTNSSLYTGAVTVDADGTTVLKALAVKSGYTNSSVTTATYNLPVIQLIVITGESNSGGYAVNADATTDELAERPCVQILNNTTLEFESLDIGTNNLIGHSGLSANATHGLELGLANEIEDGNWSPYAVDTPVYLVKTGQGGSTVAQWNDGGAYFNTFTERVEAALSYLSGLEAYRINIAVWFSHGINDALASTNVNTWKSGVLDWHSRIRSTLGDSSIPILMTKLMDNYTTYNSALDDMAAEEENTYVVSQEGTTLRDSNHWDYAGMKVLATRFVQQTKNLTSSEPQGIRCGGLSDVSGGNSEPELTDVLAFTGFVNCSFDSGTGVLSASGSGGVGTTGAVGTIGIDGTQDWTFEMDFTNQSSTDAVVFMLDTDANADYQWSGSQVFVTGVYHAPSSNVLNIATTGASYTQTSTSLSYPAKVRLTKSGSDIVYSMSVDDGETFEEFYTHSGVADHDVFYPKVLFVVPSSGQQTVIRYSGTVIYPVYVASGGVGCAGGQDGEFTGSFSTLAWGSMQNATDSGGYLTSSGTTMPAGGVATTSIDATQPFELQITWDSDVASSAIVTFLDDDNSASYAWSGGLVFINGVYQFGGNLYSPAGGYGTNQVGSNSTYPALVRFQKSGDNVKVLLSVNGGSSFSTLTTHTGVLSGKTTIYVKALFAAASASNRVKVELRTS